MAIPATISNYLNAQGIDYHVLPHPHTERSVATASAAHVPFAQLAKGVVVELEGAAPPRCVLAVLPADRVVDVHALGDILGEAVRLCGEERLGALFPDCAAGAVPALGAPYGLESVIDDTLSTTREVYFEAGDHEELIRVSGPQFAGLNAGARRGDFSYDRLQDEFRR